MKLWVLRGAGTSRESVWIGVDPKRPWRNGQGRKACYADFLRTTRVRLLPEQMVEVSFGKPKKAQ